MTLQLTRNFLGATLVAASLLLPQPLLAEDEVLGEALDAYLEEQDLSGGVALILGPNGERIATSGVADLETETPVTADTRFYIASAGKMVVAAAILAYVEDGKLALDAPVWPQIQDIEGIEKLKNANKVTLRQLLNHSSGLAEYLNDDFTAASDKQPTRSWSPAEAVAFAFDKPTTGAPGAAFEYCNTNYALLGHILAGQAGSLAKALEQKVFAKAGMSQTTVGRPDGAVPLAHGYDGDDFRDVSEEAWASRLGDGPLTSTAGDVARFARALFIDKKIISKPLLAEMTKGSKRDDSYGLGMGVDGDQWGDWFGHEGSYTGFEAENRYYPAGDVVMVFLTNGNPLDEVSFLDQAAQLYFGN